MRVELIALRSIRVGGTYFWVPALEFSTLLEVTEAGTIHVYASCTRPTRCTPVLLGFKGDLPENPKERGYILVGHKELGWTYIAIASVASNNVENSRTGAPN